MEQSPSSLFFNCWNVNELRERRGFGESFLLAQHFLTFKKKKKEKREGHEGINQIVKENIGPVVDFLVGRERCAWPRFLCLNAHG